MKLLLAATFLFTLLRNTESAAFGTEDKWPHGIVYYCYHTDIINSIGGDGQNYMRKVEESLKDYHLNTEIRFVLRQSLCEGSSTPTTAGYIVVDGFHQNSAYLGYHTGSRKVNINENWGTFKGKITHEFGHALGLVHEQTRFDRPSDVCGELDDPQNQIKTEAETTTKSGYEYKSVMHYCKDMMGAGDIGRTRSRFWPWEPTCVGGSATCSNTQLSYWDAHTIDQHYNDQYALRPQTPVSNSWPRGEFSLLMPRKGCEEGFEKGYAYFDDEDTNSISGVSSSWYGKIMGMTRSNTQFFFCTSLNRASNPTRSWPGGQYCILSAEDDGNCRSMGMQGSEYAFVHGSRYHDTEDERNNNFVSGSVPAGITGSDNQRFNFCCRNSMTSANTAVSFGATQDFVLFMRGTTCQRVTGFHSWAVWIRLDDEDDNNNNSRSGWVPRGTYDRNTLYWACHYRKHVSELQAEEGRNETITPTGPNSGMDDPPVAGPPEDVELASLEGADDLLSTSKFSKKERVLKKTYDLRGSQDMSSDHGM